MQYEKLEDSYRSLSKKNVDTGFGFERMLMFLNGLKDGYKTDLFTDVIAYIEKVANVSYGDNESTTKSIRIIADHMRTALMLIGDRNGIVPSNVGSGYILRRLMRRAIRHAKKLNMDMASLSQIARIFINSVYADAYPELVTKQDYILAEIEKEVVKFNKTIETGNKEFDKVVSGMKRKIEFMKSNNPDYVETENDRTISGKSAFRLYDTFGFPIEMTIEMANELG